MDHGIDPSEAPDDAPGPAADGAPPPRGGAGLDTLLESLLDPAMATGTLVAIATGGALLGLGWREGEPGRQFRLAGRALLERAGVASATAPLTSVALGYLHHLLVATAWGVVLALAVLPWRGARRVPAALAAAAAYGWLSMTHLPVPLRIGLSVTGTPGAAVTITAALAVGVLAGAWLANGSEPADR